MLDSELKGSVEIGFEVNGYGSECKPEIGDSHEAPMSAIQGVPLDGKNLHLVPRIMSVTEHVHPHLLAKDQESPHAS